MNDKNIYDLLNEVEFDTSEYIESNNLSKLETRRRIRNIKNRIKPIKSTKKWSSLTASVLICFTLFSPSVQHRLTIFAEAFSYDIAHYLGIEKDLEKYKTVINKSVTKQGLTIQLNEVILDNDILAISSTIKSEDGYENHITPFSSIFINGRLQSLGGGGSSMKDADGNMQSVMNEHINTDYTQGSLDIKIVYKDIMVDDKEIKDEWVFEFQTNGDELKIDTHTVNIDYSFTLPNDEEICLSTYSSNNLGQKIYGIGNATMYDIVLRGNDDLGNDVTFFLNTSHDNECLFKIETIHGNLSEEASSITLRPYTVKFPEESGRMSNDFKVTGDEFTIIIK